MPSVGEVTTHYHNTGEGFTGESATASHQKTGSSNINSNNTSPLGSRFFDATTRFVSGPLAEGEWEAVCINSVATEACDAPVVFAFGADVAGAAPSKTTSPYAPFDPPPTKTAPPNSIVLRFKITHEKPYIGFLCVYAPTGASAGYDFSLRRILI